MLKYFDRPELARAENRSNQRISVTPTDIIDLVSDHPITDIL